MSRTAYRKIILSVLAKSRVPMTVHQIVDASDELECQHVTSCTLSRMKAKGLVKSDGTVTCASCKAWHRGYQITEDGRIHLRSLG